MDELRDRNEPQEVVDWYIPPEGNEVVDYYVHRQPLPNSVRPAPRQPGQPYPPYQSYQPYQPYQTTPARPRRKLLGLWIFLGIVGTLAVLLILAALLLPDDGSYDYSYDGGDGDNGASIVDIFNDESTTIPRVDSYDPTLRLTVASAHGEELTAQEVYAKVNPATVLVVADQGDDSASVGTGIIMTADGYVITNAHVISGGSSCWVALSTGMDYDALLVGYDTDEDIAVLKLVDAYNLPTAEFGNSDDAVVGDHVYAIGNPLGIELRGTLTDGLISAINRDVELEDGHTLNVLQTTAALNNGNSGGPLINRYGQVIGINTLKMSGTGDPEEATVEGLGFALPISSAAFVINDILANGQFHGTPTIGVSVVMTTDEYGNHSVVVREVSEGYSAEEAGIQIGDVIVAVDGQPVSTTADLMAIRREHIIGDTLTLTILRDGQTFTAEIVLRSSKK